MLCEEVSRSTWMDLHLQRRYGWTDAFTFTIRVYSYTIYPKGNLCGFRWRSTDMGTGGEYHNADTHGSSMMPRCSTPLWPMSEQVFSMILFDY